MPGKGTVVLFGGFDSYMEEFFPMMLAIARHGYQVIAFEGPGQGRALEDSGLHLTRDWQLPVGAVLDHFGLEQVTLLGISLGGGLAIRAAAGEPRIARVISDDILTDFLACNLRQFRARVRTVVTALLRLRASRLMNAQQAEAALARSFLAGLPPEVTRELQAEAERADYPVGTTVYRPGSPPQAALVVSDLIRVYLTSPEGRQVTVRTPGQVTCWGSRCW